MAVVIRLARFGGTHSPKYRVTVSDQRRFRDSKYIEIVGFYNPQPRGKDVGLKLEMEKINDWIKKGAQPTDRVKHLIKLAGKAQ
jgi:small subunit ribosomal protein S16